MFERRRAPLRRELAAAIVPTVLRTLRLLALGPRRERMVLRGTVLVPHRGVPVLAASRRSFSADRTG